MLRFIPCLAILLAAVQPSFSEPQLNNFVFTQLRYDGAWDPYPEIWDEIREFLNVATTIRSLKERRVISLSDDELFLSPFLVILGQSDFPELTKSESERLRSYIVNGGVIFAEDTSSVRRGVFDQSFRRELKKIFPELRMKVMPIEHPLFRSYYFLRKLSGRKINANFLEMLDVNGRTALVYSQNDILGAWARDRLGNYLYDCAPGGEAQRFDAQKLTLNMVMFSVTGTYKSDAIHQPFLKLKE